MNTIFARNILAIGACSFVLLFGVFAVAVAQTPGGVNPSGTPGGVNPSQTQTQNQDGQTFLVNPLKVNSLEGLLGLVVKAAIRIGTIVLILAFIWIGFLFVKARGKEEELRTARAAFFWAVIGGLVLLGAEGLSRVIQSTANTLGT